MADASKGKPLEGDPLSKSARPKSSDKSTLKPPRHPVQSSTQISPKQQPEAGKPILHQHFPYFADLNSTSAMSLTLSPDNSVESGRSLSKPDNLQQPELADPNVNLPSLPTDLPKPSIASRGVSWDSSVVEKPAAPRKAGSVIQPILSAEGGSNPPPPPRPGIAMKQAPSVRSKRRLDLGDIIDPMELEAETYLLKTLEDRDPMHSRSSTLDSASILSHVPNEVPHNFTLSPGTSSDDKGAVPTPPSPRSPGSNSSTAKSRVDIPKLSIPKTHKRTLTVEENLFGLTSALSAINHPQGHHRQDSAVDDRKLDSGASSDRLARTVNLLFNRAHKNEAKAEEQVEESQATDAALASSAVPRSTASARWRHLKANLNEYKKSDGDGTGVVLNVQTEGVNSAPSAEPDTTKTPDLEAQGSADPSDDSAKSNENPTSPKRGKRESKQNPWLHLPYGDKIKEEWDTVQEFLKPRQSAVYLYCKIAFGYLMFPLLGIAAILFYFAGNPHTGYGPNFETKKPSVSWWLIFAARQIVTFSLAKCCEVFVIDFLALQTQFTLRFFGPVVTLLIVQAKGWPFMMTIWGVMDFALLAGNSGFARHWLYWQDVIGLFNERNPGGDVSSSHAYFRLLSVFVPVGCVVAVKRLAVGLYLGRQSFCEFRFEDSSFELRAIFVFHHCLYFIVVCQQITRSNWHR